MKKFTKVLFYIAYSLVIAFYIVFPIIVTLSDFIEKNTEPRLYYSLAGAPVLLVLYFLSVELPALVYKYEVQRDMISFRNNGARRINNVLINLIIIVFVMETLIYQIIILNNFDFNICFSIVFEFFFRVTIEMAYAGKKKIK